MITILDVKKLSKRFGGLIAVSELDMSLGQGEIVGLLGPNGAGKTTVFNMLAGYHKPDSGSILFKGNNLAEMKPFQVCALGIARTFQVTKIFRDITILDNVMVGAFQREKNTKKARSNALQILEIMGFSDQKNILSSELTASDQKRLEIARSLATRPDLMLLDEPMAGLNPAEKIALMDLLKNIREQGKTLLIVEHDMKSMMNLCDQIILLNFGKKLIEGTPEEVANDPNAIKAYIGEDYAVN